MPKFWTKMSQANVDLYNNKPIAHTLIMSAYTVFVLVAMIKVGNHYAEKYAEQIYPTKKS
jgi:hypothetical protein